MHNVNGSVSAAHKAPDVSVIVVNYNTEGLLERMFAALDAARGDLAVQVIVVDNASRDGSVAYLRQHRPDVEVIANDTNVGFGRGNNQAVALARGRYVLLLNTDAFVSPDTLTRTIAFMDAHAECGVLGVKLIGSDGRLQPSCRYFPTPWNTFLTFSGLAALFPRAQLIDDMSWDHASVRACDWVPGCYYLIRREVIDRVGLFDPRYFLYFEEVDHCRAVRSAGWKVMYYPFTEVVHMGGESAQTDGQLNEAGKQISSLQIESELLYFRKHYGLAGALATVTLALVADAIKAGSGLLLHRNRSRAARALLRAKTIVRSLIATNLATRATR